MQSLPWIKKSLEPPTLPLKTQGSAGTKLLCRDHWQLLRWSSGNRHSGKPTSGVGGRLKFCPTLPHDHQIKKWHALIFLKAPDERAWVPVSRSDGIFKFLPDGYRKRIMATFPPAWGTLAKDFCRADFPFQLHQAQAHILCELAVRTFLMPTQTCSTVSSVSTAGTLLIYTFP